MATAAAQYQPKWQTEAKRLRREAALIGDNIAQMASVEVRWQEQLDNSLSYEPRYRDAQDQLNVRVLPGKLLAIRADIAQFRAQRAGMLERARLMEGK